VLNTNLCFLLLIRLDFSRAYPPTVPDTSILNGHLYQLMRGEFVRNYAKPLCSDAFSGFIANDRNRVLHNEEIREATAYLLQRVVPSLARRLQAVIVSAARKGTLSSVSLSEEFHRDGVNMRYIGHVLDFVDDLNVRIFLIVEAIARVLKHALSRLFRLKTEQLRRPLMAPYRDLVICFANKVFGDDPLFGSLDFWHDTVRRDLTRRFYITKLPIFSGASSTLNASQMTDDDGRHNAAAASSSSSMSSPKGSASHGRKSASASVSAPLTSSSSAATAAARAAATPLVDTPASAAALIAAVLRMEQDEPMVPDMGGDINGAVKKGGIAKKGGTVTAVEVGHSHGGVRYGQSSLSGGVPGIDMARSSSSRPFGASSVLSLDSVPGILKLRDIVLNARFTWNSTSGGADGVDFGESGVSSSPSAAAAAVKPNGGLTAAATDGGSNNGSPLVRRHLLVRWAQLSSLSLTSNAITKVGSDDFDRLRPFDILDLANIGLRVKHANFVTCAQGNFYYAKAQQVLVDGTIDEALSLLHLARERFESALVSEPNNVDTLYFLARTRAQMLEFGSGGRNMSNVRFDSASADVGLTEHYFRRALNGGGRDAPHILFAYAKFLQRCDKLNRADKFYLRAIAMQPNDEQRLFEYSNFLSERGDEQSVRHFLNRAHRLIALRRRPVDDDDVKSTSKKKKKKKRTRSRIEAM
jgi:Translation initiation factor eIF3 subunit 135